MSKIETKIILTKEELENLTLLQQQQNDLIFSLGQTEFQLNFIKNQKNQIQQQFIDLENKQTEGAQEIEKKYGQGTVNLENGEFIKA